jgi:hypothetical protein
LRAVQQMAILNLCRINCTTIYSKITFGIS